MTEINHILCYILGGFKKKIMRYRIKIKTFKNGRKEYTTQVKAFIGWLGIMYDGNTSIIMFEQSSIEEALSRIDKHFDGGMKQSIEFEYIDRS